MLQLRLVARRVPVDSPELFDFFLGQHVAIVIAEEADLFGSCDLQQKTALTVDVIGCHAVRGGYENIDLLIAHVALKFGAADFEKVRHAVPKQFGIGRILFGAFDDNPSAGCLDAPDRLIDRDGGLGGSPALVNIRDAGVVIKIIGPGKRGVRGKLHDPRQRKERMSAQPMAKHEMPLVEILPEFFSIYQNQRLTALACGLRRHIENTRHAPRISIFNSSNKTPGRINRCFLLRRAANANRGESIEATKKLLSSAVVKKD